MTHEQRPEKGDQSKKGRKGLILHEGLRLTDGFMSLLRYTWAFPLRAGQEYGFWATSIYVSMLNYKHMLSPGDI